MKSINATDTLTRDILLLEAKRAVELEVLKEQVHATFEYLKPMNLIKNTFNNLTEAPDIKEGVGKAAIGMASGFLLKKLIFGSPINPLKNLAGAAFQAIVTKVAANNSDKIKESSVNIFETVKGWFKPKKKIVEEIIITEQ